MVYVFLKVAQIPEYGSIIIDRVCKLLNIADYKIINSAFYKPPKDIKDNDIALCFGDKAGLSAKTSINQDKIFVLPDISKLAMGDGNAAHRKQAYDKILSIKEYIGTFAKPIKDINTRLTAEALNKIKGEYNGSASYFSFIDNDGEMIKVNIGKDKSNNCDIEFNDIYLAKCIQEVLGLENTTIQIRKEKDANRTKDK